MRTVGIGGETGRGTLIGSQGIVAGGVATGEEAEGEDSAAEVTETVKNETAGFKVRRSCHTLRGMLCWIRFFRQFVLTRMSRHLAKRSLNGEPCTSVPPPERHIDVKDSAKSDMGEKSHFHHPCV